MTRLTDTEKWEKLLLSISHIPTRLFVMFFWDKCSHAGILAKNEALFKVYCGPDFSLEKAKQELGDKMLEIDNGKKLWFVGFVEFQEKGRLSTAHNRKNQALKELQKYGLLDLICLEKSTEPGKNNLLHDVYIISDVLLQNDVGGPLGNRYLPGRLQVQEKVSVTEEVREPVKDKAALVKTIPLQDFRFIESFLEIHPEYDAMLTSNQFKEDDPYYLLYKRLKLICSGDMIGGMSGFRALKTAVENIKQQEWFVNNGGLFMLINPAKSVENAKTNIAKYMRKAAHAHSGGNKTKTTRPSAQRGAGQTTVRVLSL